MIQVRNMFTRLSTAGGMRFLPIMWAAAVCVGMTVVVNGVATARADDMAAVEQAPSAALMERAADLQRDLEAVDLDRAAVGERVAQVADPANPALARLDVRIAALEQQVRDLTGQIEQLGFQVRQLNDRLEKVTGDLEFRVNRLEQGAGGTAPTAPGGAASGQTQGQISPPASGAPATAGETERVFEAPGVLGTVPKSRAEQPATGGSAATTGAGGGSSAAVTGPSPSATPQQQYAYAFDLLRSSDYQRAEEALKSFLARNPSHPLADNARYWLGETYYVRGQYPEAAQAFADAYQKNEQGPKSADALLKLGMSLARLDKKDEACATFRELLRSQPDAPDAITSKVAEEQARLGCV